MILLLVLAIVPVRLPQLLLLEDGAKISRFRIDGGGRRTLSTGLHVLELDYAE